MTDWSHNTERRIYVDCDGVLADFDSHFEKHIGLQPGHYEDAHGSKRFWETIQNEFDRFFYHLPLMPDAKELMKFLDDWEFRPIILTGCPRGDWSRLQKLKWAEKHFPGVPMITCRSAEKALFCKPGDILIDDITKYKHIWEEAGGTYVVHTSTVDTINQLEKLGVVDTFGF